MQLIDSHAHLDMLKKMTPKEAVEKSRLNGVGYIINVGASMDGSRKSVEYSREFPNVYASVGLHPHDAKGYGREQADALESLIAEGGSKVVAVGETGFDLYRNLSPRDDQEKAFRSQIELAIEHDLPVIIHNREAENYTLGVLNDYAGSVKGVVHCFSGDMAFADKCLELDLYISFTGVITFPSARDSLDVVGRVPLDKIFVETDCPFLAPQPVRGSENYPGNVKYVAEKIAEVRGITVEEVAEITTDNAVKFFSLKI